MNQDQVITVCSILVLAAMLTAWVLRRAKLRRARRWPVAPGEIQSAEVTLKAGSGQPGSAAYFAEIRYSYRVQGKTYLGRSRRRFLFKGRADKWVAEHSKQDLPVRYNPSKFSDSVLLEQDRMSSTVAVP
jgi:hypothetical protein